MALLIALWATPGGATPYLWVGGTASFEDTVWLPNGLPPLSGPPGPGDSAVFYVPGSYGVTFGSNPINQQAVVEDGNYRLLLNGHTYKLTSTPSVVVGYTAGPSPSLTLSGGTLDSVQGRLGTAAGGGGTVTVGTPGLTVMWINSGDLYVGDAGTGVMDVLYGSFVASATGYLGSAITGNGTATVQGGGSTWVNSGSLYVGDAGTGVLNVLDGSCVASATGHLGSAITGSGTATVDNSLWVNSAGLYVGGSDSAAGGTGLLTVQNSGLVNAGSLLKVWDAGTVNVTTGRLAAGGEAPGEAGCLTIGSNAAAQLSIVGGGDVSNTTGYLGCFSGGNGTATVDGAGSTWANSDCLYIGGAGTGTLNVLNGGSVSNLLGYLDNGTATVDGAGSTWTSSASFYVGLGGTAMLNVLNGGSVSNTSGYLGNYSGGKGTATVDGAGGNSLWVNSGSLSVGWLGTGTLNVLNGGRVESAAGYLGCFGGTGTALVDGARSTWTNTTGLYVGGSASAAGGTGLLTVQDSGVVNAGPLLKVWDGGTVNVTGGQLVAGGPAPGVNGSLTIGSNAAAQLSIVGGGEVANARGFLGYSSGGNGTATVDGAGSTWTNTTGLYVGGSASAAGGTGVLTVRNEGLVNAGSLLKVWGAGTVNVTGTGQLVAGGPAPGRDGSLTIGSNAAAQLSIVGGGEVSNTTGYLGYSAGGNGTATVGGADSTWNSDYLVIGREGTGTLSILDGASVSAKMRSVLGENSSGVGTATVDGYSIWNWNWSNWGTGGLIIGNAGTGTLNILNGAAVWETGGGFAGTYLGYSSSGVGTATVDGPGSVWGTALYHHLVIGREGKGTLNVQNGGTLLGVYESYLGYSGSGVGTVTVDGAGSLWTTGGPVFVGGSDGAAGGTGLLTVRNNGRVNPWSLKVWGTGTVNVTGGGLFVQDWLTLAPGGTVALEGGALQTWEFNARLGTFNWTSGTLRLTDSFGIGTGQVFGDTLSVLPGRTLQVANTLNVTGPAGVFTVDGGTVQAGALAVGAGATANLFSGTTTVGAVSGGGALNFQGGTLNVTGPAGLLVGPGGPFGSSLTLTPAQTLNVTKAMQVGSGATLTLAPGAHFTAGSLSNAGTTLVLEPTISIGTGGVSNTGTLGVYASGFNFGAGGVSNAGTLSLFVPTVDFGGGLTNTGNALFMGTTVDGTVYTPTGSTVTVLNTVTFNDLVSGAGTFWGPGTTVFNGGYSPGDSPGATSFEGSVVLGATNQLIMELAGFAPGTGYDQVNILGDVALGGELEVFVDRAFRDLIQDTDTFTLIKAAGEVTGEFLNVPPGGRLQSEDLLSEFTVYYGPGSPHGAQFVVLGGFAAIPEPGTLGLVGLGLAALLRRRRRREGPKRSA